MTTVQLSNRFIFLHALRMSMLVHSLRSLSGLGNVDVVEPFVDIAAFVDAGAIVVVADTFFDSIVVIGANVVDAIDVIVDAVDVFAAVEAIDMPGSKAAAYMKVRASNMLLHVLGNMFPDN